MRIASLAPFIWLCLAWLSATDAFGFSNSDSSVLDLVRPQNDQRNYHALTLDNGLKVFLISDPSATKAAAALDVRVGSADDPADRDGLAHFLEHMLFLGTKKYPEAGEFQTFIANSGGEYNAYTGLHNTNYYFDVHASAFDLALDRFAQFFIAPLFSEKYTEQEIHSVHSEYTSKIRDDQRREQDVFRELVVPGHPLAKFGTGNEQTLNTRDIKTLRQALLAFHSEYYQANRMSLVLSGPFDLPVLRQWAKEKFSATPKTREFAEKNYASPFTESFLPAEVHIQPKKEVRKVRFIFPLPDSEAFRNLKPLDYMAHFIGHEGTGSVIWLLRNKGWATGLNAGTHRRWQGGQTFGITIYLTKTGMANLAAIRALVFDYIALLKKHGVTRWRYDEIKHIQSMAFRYLEAQDAMYEASDFARNLHSIPATDILWHSYYWEAFDAQLISGFLSHLTAENMLTILVAPEIAGNKRSQFYSTPYTLVAKSESLFSLIKDKSKYKRLKSVLALPKKNPYFKKDQIIIASSSTATDSYENAEQTAPTKQINTKVFKGWYLRDNRFSIPKVSVKAHCGISNSYDSPQSYAAATVFFDIVNERLIEKNYAASLAGLSYSLSANSQGFDLEFYGYSNGLYEYARDVFSEIHKFSQDAGYRQLLVRQYFTNAKQDSLRQLHNLQFDKGYLRLFQEMPAYLYHPHWSREDLIDSIETLDVAAFSAWVKSASKPERCSALVYGNLDESQAEKYFAQLASLLKEEIPPPTPAARVVKTFGKKSVLHIAKADASDEVVVRYIQGRHNDLKERALILILLKSLAAPFYHSLRTEQQVGYVVLTSSYKLKDVPGFVAVVQSPRVTALDIHRRMQTFFLENKMHVLNSFEANKHALIQSLSEPRKTQTDWADFFWQSIRDNDEYFNLDKRLIAEIKHMQKEELASLYDAVLDQQHMALFIATKHAVRAEDFSPNIEILDDYREFKRIFPTYEYPD